jgi:UDPglucose 6-dehydrogenase
MNPTTFSSVQSTITILGCGYVGVTTAAILANCGFNVYAIEPNPKRSEVLKTGKSFFYEVGIDALIENGMKSGSLIIADTYEDALPRSSVVFSCVGTPDNADGSSNLSYVFSAAEQASKLLLPGTIFVQKSTVPVGTGERVEELFHKTEADIQYVSNPEFLREGTAVIDTLWFDRIVAGSDNKQAAQSILDLYKVIEEKRDNVAQIARLPPPRIIPPTQYISTARNSAELIKVSANAFLALKISFANSIAKLADKASANVIEVMDAVGADRRIGRAFLNAGRGYGGGCFPKDVSGLIRSAEEYGVDMEIMNAAAEVNSSMPHYIINKAEHALDEPLNGKNIAILGLSFKAGTSDARRSPAIAIANTLAEKSAIVHAYDPQAIEEASEELDKSIRVSESIEAAIQGAECIFIGTDWPEFKEFDYSQASGVKIIVDAMNCLDSSKLPATLQYIGVGKN